MIEKINKYFKKLKKDAIPQLSINCVIFGFHEKTLQVVVNKLSIGGADIVVLPGGYVMQTEDVLDAVERIVKESTGLDKMLFKHFAVFGDASRSFEEQQVLPQNAIDGEKLYSDWVFKRFVSICYMALVDIRTIELKPTQFLEVAQWIPVDKTNHLALDHSDMVKSARASLIRELPYAPIASNLLPKKFTLPLLQALIEAILGRNIDRPNFRRKILKSGMIVKIGKDHSGKRRPADLYQFKYGKKTSLMEEYNFGF